MKIKVDESEKLLNGGQHLLTTESGKHHLESLGVPFMESHDTVEITAFRKVNNMSRYNTDNAE